MSRLELKLKEMLQGSADHPLCRMYEQKGCGLPPRICSRWAYAGRQDCAIVGENLIPCYFASGLYPCYVTHASATCYQYQCHQAFQCLCSATNERSRLWLSNIGRKWVHLHFACTATEPSSILGPEAPVLYNKYESMIITLVLAASSCSGVSKHGPASFKPGAVGTCHPEPGC